MSYELDVPPICMTSNSNGTRLVVGCVDGSVLFLDTSKEEFKEIWRFKTKTSVRGVEIDEENGNIFAVTKNRSLCVFDISTGRRTRCILKCHADSPTAICLLPKTALKGQQLATADESGEVKTWNLRSDGVPLVRTWNEQEEEIKDLKVDSKSNLLAASSDGTLGAFDLRKAKFKVRSEVMHSELLSICPTQKAVYVGGEDGYVEVFNLTEYGNLLERIESGFDMGVTGIVELRRGLLCLSSEGSNKIRLLNVEPSKRLGVIGCHGDEKNDDDGIDAMVVSADRSALFTLISLNSTIKKWDLPPILEKIPILRAQDAKTKKKTSLGFFGDLIDPSTVEEPEKKKRKRDVDSDDEEVSDNEINDEEIEDEEEDEDSD